MDSVVLAYNNIGCAGIKALLDNEIKISAVFTHKDDSQENIFFESVAELAALNNIQIFAPEDINESIWVEKIKELKPDILFSFYYRKIIKPAILDIPPKGCLNLHGALLPKYRGSAPIQHAILNGESKTGVTIFKVDKQVDSGNMIIQKT